MTRCGAFADMARRRYQTLPPPNLKHVQTANKCAVDTGIIASKNCSIASEHYACDVNADVLLLIPMPLPMLLLMRACNTSEYS